MHTETVIRDGADFSLNKDFQRLPNVKVHMHNGILTLVGGLLLN